MTGSVPVSQMSQSFWRLLAVFVLGFVSLVVGIHTVVIGSAFTDPVSGIRSQDESFYSHSAMQMVKTGDWMTPRLLGRYFLHKPPLLMWLTALSVKCGGLSLLSVRLPVLIAGALAGCLVFSWLWASGRPAAALAGTILLLSNGLWHAYSRLCVTDALLGTWILGALYCLSRDPSLARLSAFFGFGLFTAAAIMTKSVAGLLPLLALTVFLALLPAGRRPSAARLAQVCLLIAGVLLPWHLYQSIANPSWFWAEYVKVQMLGVGLSPPPQPFVEGHLWFYLRRLLLTDPVLCALVASAAPAFWTAIRRRDSAQPALLISWIVVTALAMAAFRAKNLTYVSYLLPALCIVAAAYTPLLSGSRRFWAVGALGAIFIAKAAFPTRPWGIPFHVEPFASAPVLRAYSEKGRPNELILVSPDEEFYTAVLPIPRVRYCFIGSLRDFEHAAPHLVDLGVIVTADQFLDLSRWQEQFRQRMSAWRLNSTEAVATAIVAGSEHEVLKLIQAHPQADFYLPVALRGAVESLPNSLHQAVPGTDDRFFLLAEKAPPGRAGVVWPLPRHW